MIVSRGALTDHYVEDERSVVMVDESVLGLSPIATAILDAVPDGAAVSLAEVTRHVVATFGEPEGPESAEALTEQQLWDLVAHRVLVVVDEGRRADGAPTPGRTLVSGPANHEDPDGAVTALRNALRHLRSDDEGRWPAPESLSPQDLVRAAQQHHVVPYLASNLDRLDIPARARSELEVVAGRQRAGAAVLAADLSVALEALRNAGVRALAFKGVALSSQAYGDFTLRGAGDLDLLVRPVDLERAHDVLRSAGWAPAPDYPTPGPSWAWRHFVRTNNEVLLSGTRSDIDLHWHLVPTRGTFPDFDILWERRNAVSVDGRMVATLARYDAMTHSAGHAAKDGWQWLRSLVDVHMLASQPDTWRAADRPLRGDEALTLGLAVDAFGRPAGSPRIVAVSARLPSRELIARVHHAQVETSPSHRPFAVPGIYLTRNLRGIRRTSADSRELVRLLSRSLLPPWHTADLTSPSAVEVVPRVIYRRAVEVAAKAATRVRGLRS